MKMRSAVVARGLIVAISAVSLVAGMVTPAHAAISLDGAGIELRDSASSGPPATSFIDVLTVCGLPCRINEATDDAIIPIAPPAGQPNWPFHWSSDVATQGVAGGTAEQATVWLDTNGYIAFQQPVSSVYNPTALPATAAPNAVVAGVWTDLNPAAVTGTRGIFKWITGTSPNRQLFLQWNEVPDYGGACATFTFQFVLYELDNSIVVHYRNNPCTTRTAVGGYENGAGTTGATYFNSTSIPDLIAVRYRDVVAPQPGAPVVTCGTPGTNGWCRSATNTITIGDNGDLRTTAVGVGVKSRTWRFLPSENQGNYANGVGMSVTRIDGTHSALATATDWANNSGTSPSSTLLRVDTVSPTLTATLSPAANGNGWHKGDVTATWSCSDATSGVASCPAPSTIGGEGTSLTASQTILDVAGNSTTTTTSAVKIDRTPPATTASAPSGWSSSNAVSLSASDALSGVAATRYKVNGGATQTGTSLTLPEGTNTVEFWSEDRAGNIEPTKSVQVRVDRTAPTITHTLSPAPNAAGWTRAATTVTFTCGDALSGVATCTPPATQHADVAGLTVVGTATDVAGNTAQDVAVVNLDQTQPTIDQHLTPDANADGWHNAPVVVEYWCDDWLSGVASCPGFQTLDHGANQTASGVAFDAAGNSRTITRTGINIDLGAPTVAYQLIPAPTSNGWHKGNVTVKWLCSDDLSGVASCPADVVVTGTGPGLTVSSGLVADRAGNLTSTTVVVNIDRTAPVLVYEGHLPLPNEAGWNRTAVDMLWSCYDDESSTSTPAIVKKVAFETSGTSQTATCTNFAGLSSSDTRGPVRIDMTGPVARVNAPGAAPVLIGAEPAIAGTLTGTSTDSLSGTERVVVLVKDLANGATRMLQASCACSGAGVSSWQIPASSLGAGTFEVRARGFDRAGNQGADSAPVTIVVAQI